MPDDSDRLVNDIRSGLGEMVNSSPLVAPGRALESLGDKAVAAKDYGLSKARSLGEDLADHVRSYFTAAPAPGRDIELPRDPKTARSKPVTRPRTLAGGKR